MSGSGKNVFLFVVWSAARAYERQILDEIGKRFKILRTFEVAWPRRHFTRNLAAFYGWKGWFCWWNKARKCGRGPFLAIVVEDPNPEWANNRDTSGRVLLCNANVYGLKMKLRRMTGHSNRVHASVTPEETAHQLAALEGIAKAAHPYGEGIGGGEPISISFCISDNYAQHLAVVITSLLENNPDCDFVFHVVHHSVRPETEAKIRQLEKAYPRHRIVFHAIDGKAFARFPLPKELSHITGEMYYRYLLPEILRDERRTIYSDVDVLCRAGGIRDLWEMDLGGRPMGAVRKLTGGGRLYEEYLARIGMKKGSPFYFSGLLLMDLQKLREERFAENCMRTTAEKADVLAFPDMDVINVVMDGRMADIDPVWNMTERFSFFRRDVKIWHFLGQTQKPWCCIWKNVTWIPYLKYLLKGPYRGNALRFVLAHARGWLFFKYTKKCVTRYLVCGILVWKRREATR